MPATFGEKATPQICAAFTARYGLDQPIWQQFVIYLGALLQGDLGQSIRFGRPVSDLLVERLPVTVELTLLALLFASVGGMTLGVISATRRNSPADVGTMVVANLGVSIPVFVLGLFLAFVFAVLLKGTPFALPPSGRLSPGGDHLPLAVAWGLEGLSGPPRAILDFLSNMYLVNGLLTAQWDKLADALRHLILPAIALGTIPLAIIARMTRSSLLEVLGLDYVRTARAKGLRSESVVVRHGMRNALLPVVTVDRPLARGVPVGRRPDRDDLQPDRRWARRCSRRSTSRLQRGPGGHARRRHRLPRRQPVRRHLVRLPRPADPPVSADSRTRPRHRRSTPRRASSRSRSGATRSRTSCASARRSSA